MNLVRIGLPICLTKWSMNLKTKDYKKKSITCHGLSQSSGIGQAPNQAPITAP